MLLILSAIIVDNPDIIIKDGGVNTDYEEATALVVKNGTVELR